MKEHEILHKSTYSYVDEPPALVSTPNGVQAIPFEALSRKTGSYQLGELEILLAASHPNRHLTPFNGGK